jgi:hypothetical protein
MRLIECEGTRDICLWLTYRRIRGPAGARKDPNADARIHVLAGRSRQDCGAGVGAISGGGIGDDPGVDTPLRYRDRHRLLGGGTGRAAGLTCSCASRLLPLEYG